MFKDARFVGHGTVYFTNMYTGQEEFVTGLIGIRAQTIGQLQVEFVLVITENEVLEIPDFCLATRSQYLLREVA